MLAGSVPEGFLRRRSGFTLVELLVVIAIIGVLIGLLLPAVQSARESARRVSCTNNAKQLGLACLTFADARKTLPPGVQMHSSVASSTDYNENFGPNWAMLILPFMEQSVLFDSVQASVRNYMSTADSGWRQARTSRIPTFVCPSDRHSQVAFSGAGGNWARGNYGANATTGMFSVAKNGDEGLERRSGLLTEYSGTIYLGNSATNILAFGLGYYDYLTSPRGLMSANTSTALRQVTDGLSKTVLLDELRVGTVATDLRGTWAMGQAGASIVAGSGRGDSPGPNVSNDGYDDIMDGLNDPRDGMGCYITDGSCQVTAKSLHPGGVNMCLADGSVRFISNSIARGVYQVIHSRDDGVAASVE